MLSDNSSLEMAFVPSLAIPTVSRRPRVRLDPVRPRNPFILCPRHAQVRLSRWPAAVISRPIMVATRMDNIVQPPESSPSQTERPRIWTGRNGTAVAATVASLATVFAIAPKSGLASLFSRLVSLATELGVARGAALIAGINFCTVLLCFPANMGLMIGAGAILGPLPAFLALFLSKVAAACVAFLLARSVLYSRVQKWLQRYPKMHRVLLDSGRDGGWKFVVLMRLSPFPGFLLNYLLSLTGVSFLEYTIGTLVGIAPSVANLVLMGATVRDVGVGAAGGSLSGGWLGFAFKAFGMLSMVIVSVIITRRARRAFAELDDPSFADQHKTVGT